MAQKVQVVLLCDVDNGDTDAQETLKFSLDGNAYEIDVCARHAQQIQDALQPFVAHARKAAGASAPRRARAPGARRQTASIRSWAKDHRITVNDRGRIPASVVKDYEAAH